MPASRTYLDHAATSWPKPPGVAEAMVRAVTDLGCAAGRGGYAEAIEVGRTIERLRVGLATLLGAAGPDRVVLTRNGTEGLNLVLHGYLRPGDALVTTAAEHNSVLRPAEVLRSRGVRVAVVPVCGDGRVDPAAVAIELANAADADPAARRLLAVVHASNVTGVVQPIEELLPLAERYDARVLLDAAQTAGTLPLDLRKLPVDFLAAPGHKGLLGPLGTGLLVLGPGREAELFPQQQGGTGSRSESLAVADEPADRFEVGNSNVPGLFGLEAAIRFILGGESLETVAATEEAALRGLEDRLRDEPDWELFSPPRGLPRAGVLSLRQRSTPPQDTAALLEAEYRIQVRAGLHCAPWMHESLRTAAGGGTVRLSIGRSTTAAELHHAADALCELGRMLGGG